MAYTDEQRAYHRAYYVKRRQKLIDYLGGHCAVCDTTDGLHFDHINPREKSFEIKSNLSLNEKTRSELDKCQLLCEAHHLEKTARENSGFVHGSMYGWMKKKCQCDECVSAKWSWHDTRNAQRRKGDGYNVTSRRGGETR